MSSNSTYYSLRGPKPTLLKDRVTSHIIVAYRCLHLLSLFVASAGVVSYFSLPLKDPTPEDL